MVDRGVWSAGVSGVGRRHLLSSQSLTVQQVAAAATWAGLVTGSFASASAARDWLESHRNSCREFDAK